MTYSVQSLHGLKNAWEEVYAASSLKAAVVGAKRWQVDVCDWRASGRVHHSRGVHVIKVGDVGDAMYVREWA